MGAPQIILIAILFLGTGMHLARDGEPRNAKYSFGAAIFSDAFLIGILWWGGFFG